MVSPGDLRWRETVETFLWEQLSALESVRHVARRLVVRHSMVFDDGCRWHGCDAQKPAGYILSQSGSVCCACTKEKIRASEHLRLERFNCTRTSQSIDRFTANLGAGIHLVHPCILARATVFITAVCGVENRNIRPVPPDTQYPPALRMQ